MHLTPERTVLAVGLLGGLLFTFVTPPFQAPDEPAHLRRAWQLGGAVPLRPGPTGQPGAEEPASVERLIEVCQAGVPFHPERRLPAGTLVAAWRIPLDPVHRTFTPLGLMTPYPLAAYLPQAAAAAAGRAAGLRPLATLYLVRLANLAACLALAWAAVRMAPFQKWALAFLALTPMAMFLRSTASADALTFAAALLVTAAVGAIACPPDGAADATPSPAAAPPPGRVACLLAAAALTALGKGYLVIDLLVPAIPPRRLGSRPRWAALAGAVAVLCVLGAWSASRLAGTFFDLHQHDPAVHPQAQLRLVLAHPLAFLGLAGTDYLEHLPRYVAGFVGNLGWLDTPLPVYVVVPYALLLVGLALTGGDASIALPRRLRLAAAAITAAGLLFVSVSQYLTWTPLGAHRIEGVQGRYFLPLAAAGMLLFYNRRARGAAPAVPFVRRDNLLALTSATFTAAALARTWVRYHGW